MDTRSPGPVARLKQLRVFTTTGVATSFSDVARLLSNAKQLGRNEKGRTSSRFVGNGEDRMIEILYHNKITHRIPVSPITTMVNALLAEATVLVCLLAQCTREYILELRLEAIQDCPYEPRQRMSFVETNPHLANGKERMEERWQKMRGCNAHISDKFLWDDLRHRFLRLLFLLCYWTASQPFQLKEAFSMTLYRVGPGNGRNGIQVHRGYLTLIMKVIKGTEAEFFVPWFALLQGLLMLLGLRYH